MRSLTVATPPSYISPPTVHAPERPVAAPNQHIEGGDVGGNEIGDDDRYLVATGGDLATISDRGTSADVVSLAVAEQLVKEHIIDKIHTPEQTMRIQFGITSAQSRVIGEIHGAGLIGVLYVVADDLPTVLISDITFTTKGVRLIQDNSVLIGVAGGRVIFEGVRDPLVPRSDPAALWRLDLRKLLQEEDPRRAEGGIEEDRLNASAMEIVQMLVAQQQYVGGHEGIADDPSVIMLSCGAKPTYRVADIRSGRRAVKNFGGISSLTIANTIERNALKNIGEGMTPALFRALFRAKGNVPQLMSTARKPSQGGTGIRSTVVGETVAFDDVGKFVASTFGIQYAAIFRDEASSYVSPYGLESKADLVEALKLWCQFVESCGKGPVRYARCDATSLVSRVDGDLTEEFRVACAELKLDIRPSAPEDQATNPEERGYQTISHRMAALMLQQDNLKKENWWLFLVAACVYDTVVCHKDATATPCELLRGIKPSYDHITEFFPGQLAICPRVGSKKLLESNFQLCVTICPVLHNNAWVVLLEGSSQPQIRSRLQSVGGVELRDLTAKEASSLQPELDATGRLTEFHSRTSSNFTLKNKMKAYDNGNDLQELEAGGTLLGAEVTRELEAQRMLKPVPRRSNRLAGQKRSAEGISSVTSTSLQAASRPAVAQEHSDDPPTHEDLVAQTRVVGDADQQEIGAGEVFPSLVEDASSELLHSVNMASLFQIVDDIAEYIIINDAVPTETDLLSVDETRLRSTSPLQSLYVLRANKARAIHTDDNPTVAMLEKDPVLAAIWRPCTDTEISGSIMNGSRVIISEEEKAQMKFIEYPLIFVYTTKRDGTRKCRAATDGRAEAVEWFDQDSLFAEGVLPMVVKLLTAFGVYYGMVDMSTDVAQCFTRHNLWQDAQVQRRICHKLTAYQSPTGEPAWIADLTLNYGLRDGPGHWRRHSDHVLIDLFGMTRSRIVNQVFFKFRGDKGLLVLCKITDDFKVLHTDDPDGLFMRRELLQVLQLDQEMELTINIPTNDYSSLYHTFETVNGARTTVTLHQPTQIKKVAQHFFGEDLADVPEEYCPFHPQWSAAASIQCTQRMPVADFMSGLGKISWTCQTRMESPFHSLLACRGLSPSALDGAALKHHAAYLWTTRAVGITFHPGPESCDIRVPMPIHAYADSGQNSHPDGSAQIGLAFYVGELGHPGGAFFVHSQKADGVVGESVPVDECMALVKGAKLAVFFRHLLEEAAGLTRGDVDTSEMLLEGSSPPTVYGVSDKVVTVMQHDKPGHLGAPAADVAAYLLATGQPPPCATSVYQDNEGVVNNVRHISAKSKGLMRITRVVSFLQGLHARGIVSPVKSSSEEMRADPLTKQITSPTEHWRKAAMILGEHSDVTALVQKVERKFNKRLLGDRERQRLQQVDDDNHGVRSDRQEEEMRVLPVNSAVGPCLHEVGWVRSASVGVKKVLKVQGFYDEDLEYLTAATETAQKQRQFTVTAAAPVLNSSVKSANLPLPERLRVALAKLTPEERLLFSTRLLGTQFEDMLPGQATTHKKGRYG